MQIVLCITSSDYVHTDLVQLSKFLLVISISISALLFNPLNFPLQAMEYFEKAAANEESGGRYNLGVMYFEGVWVKRDMKLAFENIFAAGLAGHQLALRHILRIVRTTAAAPRNDLVMVKPFFPFGLFSASWFIHLKCHCKNN